MRQRRAGRIDPHARKLLKVGWRELSAPRPDALRLAALLHDLDLGYDLASADFLVTIFERSDLPSWLRGDAADKLGRCNCICDRRRKLFRRCRATALAGLSTTSVELQFGSMYLLGCLAAHRWGRRPGPAVDLKQALPLLRRIAAQDQRFSPGYWWPMSAEAEDIIVCIRTGRWPKTDASERWQGKGHGPGPMESRE